MSDAFDSVDWTIPSKELAAKMGVDLKLVYRERAKRKITKLKLRRIPDSEQPQDHKLIKCKYGELVKVSNEDYERVAAICWAVRNKKNQEYPRACVTRKVTLMHHFILGKQMFDHKNGDKLDNRRENLRPATKQQNIWNRPKLRPSASHYKGVFWDFKKNRTKNWRAKIGRSSLGYYLTQWEAALAYDAAARKLFGEFARLNFVVS